MSKLKESVTKMNPRKGYCNLIICAVIFCILAGIGTGVKFGNRISEMKQQMEMTEKSDSENERNLVEEKAHERKEDGKEQKKEKKTEWMDTIKLSTGDYVFLGCVAGVLWILLCIYWLYTTAYVVSKAWELGVNAWVFGILTLVTNIFGLACLWIYTKFYHVCPGCGKLQPKKANYCGICGAVIYKKCPECGNRISIKDAYCNSCGKKM